MALTAEQVDSLSEMLRAELPGIEVSYAPHAGEVACFMAPEGLLALVARLRGDDPDALAALAALA